MLVRYDVIVSGGGPAGALAARGCAQHGLKVLLIDRSGTEDSKCCGGGLLERTIRSMNMPLPSDVIEREVRGGAFVWRGERHELRDKERIGVTVRRQKFDAYLRDNAANAGAETITAETRKVENGPAEVRVRTTEGDVNAKALIIAEGCTSRSAAQIFGPYPLEDRAMGMISECTFIEDFPDVYEFEIFSKRRPRVQFEYPGHMNGWAFPLSGGANVGVGWLRCSSSDVRLTLDKLIRRIARERGGLKHKTPYRAHPIPVRPRAHVYSGRCLLVGDAAGLASPITGEGMSYAVTSGNLAAQAVVTMFDDDERLSSLKCYEPMLGNEVIFTLKAARAISIPVNRLLDPLDPGLLADNYASRDSLQNCIFEFIKGEASWKPLFCRSFLSIPWLFFSSLAVHKLYETERSVYQAEGGNDKDRPGALGTVEPGGGEGT